MNDSPDSRLDALFARARAARPDTTRAEYGFETRLLARLREQPAVSGVWSMASWRMAPWFATAVIVLGFVTLHTAGVAQDSAQAAYAQNPEAADLEGSFD